MKIFIACSKHFYNKVDEIKKELEKHGHKIALPNSFDNPLKEEELKKEDREKHIQWKAEMMKKDKTNILPNEAILVLNFEKNNQPNYIGGATFLEIYKAWELDKKIYLYNPIPDNLLKDEITGMNPVILNGNLNLIR
ncbi:hypothetical protein HYW76_05660 [Candidatus Pacearchaeota archaeon]|nr:hypothetical protein [Candidatus Pacearchaeota archaeon]